jgi:hypothetical protein
MGAVLANALPSRWEILRLRPKIFRADCEPDGEGETDAI